MPGTSPYGPLAPDPFESWTNCSTPADYSGDPKTAAGIIGGVSLVGLLASLVTVWVPGVAAFGIVVCGAFIVFCNWWLEKRLVCLGGTRSAVGLVYNVLPPDDNNWPPTPDNILGSFDTDYSFNVLLWQFSPQDTLPGAFHFDEGDTWPSTPLPYTTSFAQLDTPAQTTAESTLSTNWPTLIGGGYVPPHIQYDTVSEGMQLILPQQSMASLRLGFNGQCVFEDDEPATGQPFNANPGPSFQSFLLHCEIEGPGMYYLRSMMYALLAVFIAAAILAATGIGAILAFLLGLLAFLAGLFGGAIIQKQGVNPPAGSGYGGSELEPYRLPDGTLNPAGATLVYVRGRWIYDSLHSGWNELHPLEYLQIIAPPGDATGLIPSSSVNNGDWPDLSRAKEYLDGQYKMLEDPKSAELQAEPQNQWQLHPLLDGCLGPTPYPEPTAPADRK